MKRILFASLAVLTLSASAFADTPAPAPAAAAPEIHPCKQLEEACKSAGFVKGDKNGKGLFKDCIKPLSEGQSVAGVNVDASLGPACKAKKGERFGKHRGTGAPINTPSNDGAPATK
jgi:hypothetical protein